MSACLGGVDAIVRQPVVNRESDGVLETFPRSPVVVGRDAADTMRNMVKECYWESRSLGLFRRNIKSHDFTLLRSYLGKCSPFFTEDYNKNH
jgi:hypothetical protein